jgi:hypothetical protein
MFLAEHAEKTENAERTCFDPDRRAVGSKSTADPAKLPNSPCLRIYLPVESARLAILPSLNNLERSDEHTQGISSRAGDGGNLPGISGSGAGVWPAEAVRAVTVR